LIAGSMLRPNSTTRAMSPDGRMRGKALGEAVVIDRLLNLADGFLLSDKWARMANKWWLSQRINEHYRSRDCRLDGMPGFRNKAWHTTPESLMSLSPEAVATLKKITTATITTILLKKGLRNVWLRGSRPLRPGQERLVGPAFTLRFVPAREDLATPESWSKPISTRTAIEAMPAGCIAVVDAMGITDAGIFGDILCARMAKRGVTALVTDGVVRDLEGVLGTGLPVWCDGAAAPPSVAGLTFVNWGEPIGCGGVAVFPDDVIVADQDGAVLIPQAFLDLILTEGPEQEAMEGWIVNQVNNGAALPGLYPMNAETKARYAASKK
jgi:regulator of RNase E activity RraA